jgi:hypothetical protein
MNAFSDPTGREKWSGCQTGFPRWSWRDGFDRRPLEQTRKQRFNLIEPIG